MGVNLVGKFTQGGRPGSPPYLRRGGIPGYPLTPLWGYKRGLRGGVHPPGGVKKTPLFFVLPHIKSFVVGPNFFSHKEGGGEKNTQTRNMGADHN